MHRGIAAPALCNGLLAALQKATPAVTSYYKNCCRPVRVAFVSVQTVTSAAVGSSQLSYVHGANNQSLLGQTVGANLAKTAIKFPNRPAILSMHQKAHLTYAELNAAVALAAKSLLGMGVCRGDRVAVFSPNSIEWITTMYATAGIGAILVPLNPSYKDLELAHALLHSQAKVLISGVTCKGVDMLQTVSAAVHHVLAASATSAQRLESLVLVDTACHKEDAGQQAWAHIMQHTKLPPHLQVLHWAAIAAAAADITDAHLTEAMCKVQLDDPAQIQYTSGTTGHPKGVTLSHHSLLNNAFFIGQGNRFSEHDRVCLPVPLFHCFGCVLGALAITTHGASMVFPGEGFDPGQALQAVQQEGCTALYGVPTMFIAELAHPQFASFDLGSLQKGIMAGSPCPQDVMQKVIHQMHMKDVTICYGMTETSPVSFQSSPDDDIQHRVSTIGRVHPHVEAKVIDPVTGETLLRGQVGELCTRGYFVMLGYWDDDAATRQVIDQARWMHTGDLAVLDDDGYCKIVGRLKDMIIRGGENISPREIEDVIHRHPGVLDVQVVGVPDEKYGQEVCAWVRLHDGSATTAQELRQWCRDAVAAFKVPRYWKMVHAYPMTASGKVQKYLMRQAGLCELTDCSKVPEKPV